MKEIELLKDCLVRLNQSGIAYLVTGSMASNFWGIPRTTHDLDFAIQLPPSQVSTVVRAFADHFYIDESAVRAAYQPPYQFNAIDPRSALKVDFWLPVNTPFEREMFRRRVQQQVFGVSAWIATAEDIILHKLYWNRLTPSERQRTDAAGVYRVQRGSLDLDYLQRWAEELLVRNALDDILHDRIRPKLT